MVPLALGLRGLLYRLDPLCLTGFGNQVAVGLLKMHSQAFGLAILVGPHAKASDATTGLFLPSFLGS
jgi:hypothetical protein